MLFSNKFIRLRFVLFDFRANFAAPFERSHSKRSYGYVYQAITQLALQD